MVRMLVLGGLVGLLGLQGVAAATTVYGVAGGGSFLVKFESSAPGVLTQVAAITGMQPGERIVDLDFRPHTGQLFGVGITTGGGAVDTLRLYRLDPATGVATVISPAGILVTAGPAYDMDFNPTVDRVRVVNAANENVRLNPISGVRVDLPVTDTDLNPVANYVDAIAYDRTFDHPPAMIVATTLYGLSINNDTLVTIGGIDGSPSPNGGTIQSVGPLGLDATGDAGFDIDVDGTGWATMTVGGATSLYTIALGTGAATLVGEVGDGNLPLPGIAIPPPTVLAVGADSGSPPLVRVLDGGTRTEVRNFLAFPQKTKGGVRVAVGDVTGDGVPEVVAATGKGASPEIRVFDGVTGAQLGGAFAGLVPFDPKSKGGVSVAVGDVNGDGVRDVIAGDGPGGTAHVKVFYGTPAEPLDFGAFEASFKGGVQVASADFDGDGHAEIVVAAGKGGGARVRVFDSLGEAFASPALPAFPSAFPAYPGSFKSEVYVAAGDVDGDGVPDIVTGAGKGSKPEVAIFSGVNGALLGRFLAFDAKEKKGVRVGVGDVDGDGRYDVLATPGGGRGPTVRAFDGRTLAMKAEFPAFDSKYRRGVFVAGVRR